MAARHLFCTHPKTKAGRAACRRDSKNLPGTKLAAPVPAIESEQTSREMDERIQAERDALKGCSITPQNWREFRGLNAEIIVLNNSLAGQGEYLGEVVAWGPKRFTYRSKFTGTLNHCTSALVVSVVALRDQD